MPNNPDDEHDEAIQHTDRFSLEGFDPLEGLRTERIAVTLKRNRDADEWDAEAKRLGLHESELAAHNPHERTHIPVGSVSAGDPMMMLMPELKVKNVGRGGRNPAFYRVEVDRIRADKRSLVDIAAHYGVTTMTIRRVKGLGTFAGLKYIPADEVDRRITEDGEYVQDVMNPGTSRHVPTGKRAGRPFKTRDKPMTDVARKEIIASRETVRVLAERYKVSAATISRIRRDALAPIPEGMTIYEAMARDIRPPHVIARMYRTSAAQVYAARQRFPQAYAEAQEAWRTHPLPDTSQGNLSNHETIQPYEPPDGDEFEHEYGEPVDEFGNPIQQLDDEPDQNFDGPIDPRGHEFDDEPDTILTSTDADDVIPPMEELFSPEAIAAFKALNK